MPSQLALAMKAPYWELVLLSWLITPRPYMWSIKNFLNIDVIRDIIRARLLVPNYRINPGIIYYHGTKMGLLGL